MGKSEGSRLFDTIAPVYDLFFHLQRKRFSQVIRSVKKELDLCGYCSVLDVGCGTGALCSVLSD